MLWLYVCLQVAASDIDVNATVWKGLVGIHKQAVCGNRLLTRLTYAWHALPAVLQVAASDTDVNVISWNRLVGYMVASGDDGGLMRVWDLRAFKEGGYVSQFNFHK
jgi:hypothetical protein